MLLDERAGVPYLLGSDEGAAERDHRRVDRVDRHVHDGSEVPLMPAHGRGAHAPGPNRWRRIAASPSACGGGVGDSRLARRVHDEAALVVGGDEQQAARAPRASLEIGGERAHLPGSRDVARLARARVALEEDEAAHLDVADERADLLVALDLRTPEADQQELAERQGRFGRGAVAGGCGRASLDDENEEQGAEPQSHVASVKAMAKS